MSATTGFLRRTVPAARDRVVPFARNWKSFLWVPPALLALVYLIALLANFGSVITSINMDSDASAALMIGKLIGQAPAGSQVVLGNHPYYEEYLFLRATSGLPFYRQLWDIAPFLWALIGTGLLAWSAKRALGGFAALLSAVALICLGHLGRFSFFVFDWHGLSVVHTILIGAALVWLAPRAADIGWGRLIALAIVLGLLSAAPVASDKLFPFWALIPMVLVAVLMAWRSAGRARLTVPAFSLIAVAVAALAGALLAHEMRVHGVTSSPFKFTFVTPGNIVNNVELLFEGFMSLGGGYFLGMSPGVLGDVVFVTGALILGALALGLAESFRLARAAGPRPAGGEPPSAKLAYVGFWSSSLLIQCVVFVSTSVPVDTLSSRYVLAGYAAIAALTGVLAVRGPMWRLAVTAGVCLFAISGIYQLARRPFDPGSPFPGPAVANQLVRFARANDVRYGYGGYWDAADLTWLTRFKLKVYPVTTGCGPIGLCPYPTGRINTWYQARPGERSMLIADTAQPGVGSLTWPLRKPVARARIGQLLIAVYPYDIASRFF